jgi:probable F420-dependent oxidoreductase
MKIRFAVSTRTDPGNLRAFGTEVEAMEALGFDTMWMSDIPLGATLDPIVGLAFAAAATSRLKLGTNLVPVGRNPLTLAKSLAQVDQLSAGRLLLSFVIGLDQPGERQTLGLGRANRGLLIEEVVPLLRAWWAGESVTHLSEHFRFDDVPSPGRSFQDPLEVWFGGSGPVALARVGRLADGWLGSAMSPPESAAARERIEKAAAEAGRVIDPEHFGLSIPYASSEPDARSVQLLRDRRPDVDLAELFPIGPNQLRTLVSRYIDAGLSKFVVRSVNRNGQADTALAELADILLPMQT